MQLKMIESDEVVSDMDENKNRKSFIQITINRKNLTC